MPADWTTFISNVSNKLDGQTIQASYDPELGDVDDFATYLAQQYTTATVGKAQSPYGNTHQQGSQEILKGSFSKAFKMLETEKTPTLEDKQKDPKYQDLRQEPTPQKLDEELDKFDLEFLAWTEANATTIPDFVYSSFFSQFPNFPATEDQQATEVARRIINRFDGTSDYLQWIYSLKLQQDQLAGFATKVYDKIIELTQGIGQTEIKVGDEVQAVVLYDLLPNGTENTSARSKSGELVRGKIVSITQSRNFSGAGSLIYRVSVQTPKGTVQRIVDPNTIQKKLTVSDFLNVRDLNLSRKILQETNSSDPTRIPSFVTAQFITRFTYDPQFDTNLFSKILYEAGASKTVPNQFGTGNTQIRLTRGEIDTQVNAASLSENVLYSGSLQSFLNGNTGNIKTENSFILSSDYLRSNDQYTKRELIKGLIDRITGYKITKYNSESTSYLALKQRYINFLIEKERKTGDTLNENDPYQIMADGVIRYWQSCLAQPLSASPPVPPCTILPPNNGFYVGIYYGSIKTLSDNLRRAFNDGKSFKNQKTGKIVASSLAFSFQKHLLELKFLYNGGVPTPGGPAPMIGFVPLVF
jgi:hypothetical protein